MVGGFPLIKKRRRLRRNFKILKYFGLTIAFLFLVLLILFSAEILSFKQLYSQAVSGRHNLEQAIISAEQAEFSQAMVLAGAALADFNFSADELGRMKNSYLANRFPFLTGQLNGLESLLVANRFISQAIYSGANLGKNLENLTGGDKKLNFSKFSPAEKRQVLGKIFESTPELNGIKADLILAYAGLDQVNAFGALFPFKKKIVQTKKQIDEARKILEKAVPLSQLLPVLAGYPKSSSYLVVLQDNDELRPTGGLLDGYGILRFTDGDLINFNTRDIYYLDMPAKGKIGVIPPEPIKKYLVDPPAGLTAQAGGWYLRDANWSPDWPTAAQKIDWFYRLESRLNPAAEKNPQFNGVIGLTPKLITYFLRVIGPVAVKGQVYDQTNFRGLLESRAEDGSSWAKKEIIGEIVKELKNKIFAWPVKEWTKTVNLLADNLASKDLLLYFSDKQLENIAVDNGWGGEIKSTAGDYLMVVDANLGGEKTDVELSRSLEYKVTQNKTGLFSKLTLNYAHHGGPGRQTGVYKSYTRVYAPLGSQLISSGGYSLSQIDLGGEAGKTWFGFYFEVQPGEIKNITIEYKLPALAAAPQNYELYLQKQPGKEINETIVDLSFLNDIKSYSPASLYARKISPGRIRWEGDLNIDRKFEVNF